MFDLAFSRTGGEDKELLMRMRIAGAVFAWSNEAFVYESFPSSRSTREWALQRAYRVGNSEMLACMKVRPPLFWLKEPAKIAIALGKAILAHSVHVTSPVKKFRGRIAFERVKGKLGALLGRRYYEYTKVHGS